MERNFILKHNPIPSLFTLKDEYLLSHTNNGKDWAFKELPDRLQRQLKCDNRHLGANLTYTENNGFPILKPYNSEILDIPIFPYSQRQKHKSGPWGVHFFQYDYTFIKAITCNLERTTSTLIDCEFVFAPDCSLYVDGPVFMNKQNIFRSRFAAAYWQSCGFNVIQTASWGDANSLKYCFEGLASNSVTAVCGIGHEHCKAASMLWEYAINKLVEVKSPTKLIIYGGNQNKIPDFGVPVYFIEDFITKNFRRK